MVRLLMFVAGDCARAWRSNVFGQGHVQIFFRCFHAVSMFFLPSSPSCRHFSPRSEVKGGKEAQLGPDVELPAFTDRVYIGGKVRT